MKKFLKLFSGPILMMLLLSGCTRSDADNKGLEYESLDVNFKAIVQGDSLAVDYEVAVIATCTRGESIDLPMSQNNPAHFVPVSSGMTVNLVKKTDEDNILSYAGDHNFKFSAFLPASAYDGDLTTLVADVPAVVEYGVTGKSLQVAKAAKTSVVAPVELAFESVASQMVINIPGNILGNDHLPVLKSIEIKPYDEAEFFGGMLAFNATYDLLADQLNIAEGSAKKSVTVNFGENGFALKTGYSSVCFAVAPFTVPFGGFLVTVTDVDGNKVESEVLVNDGGASYKAGETVEFNLTRPGEDGIIPCNSPVEWPIGYDENDNPRALKADYVDMWPTNGVATGTAKDSHIWKNVAQPQATATWIVSSDNPNPKNIGFEFNNILDNGGVRANYASPCVKGIWTGDGFEFVVPVKNIAAGTNVTLSLPAFGRGAPVFWNVEYLDGVQWKCNKTLQKSPDGQFEMECTWSIPHGNVNKLWGGHVMTHTMRLENAIRSGYIKIRFVCAAGQYTTAAVSVEGDNKCHEIKACPYSGSNLFAFVNMDDVLKSVSISWELPQSNN